MQRKVGIIGAGVSGLLVCKYALCKGFNPIVFESQSTIGGVWTKTLRTTKLQTPKPLYQFSDFPWPPSVTEDFPDKHKPFSPMGKWKLIVEDLNNHPTRADFVIICVGRFSGVPNIPEFPPNKGPEAFHGKVIHSMDYAAMEDAKAVEFIKGKRVLVVGFQKSALDMAMECSTANGMENPCTVLYRTAHWNLPDYLPWGFSLAHMECIQPRIPQLAAVIGYSKSVANLYTSEIRCRWLVELLDGTFKLPSIEEMEKDVKECEDYLKQYSGVNYKRKCIGALHVWYKDQLCKDTGWSPRRRKTLFAELFVPYGPLDYVQ
ncbi:Flavin-dependent monooxygenase 1-like protein [Hibiscus syriacus]|uniref:Flavin-containing monooxygenase n=1 Tax=Hibiscus syriacus TaxID=106335 RepID=A0A6A3CA85_HIBSY|nr:Flavin-dependent monooxygenase 1-like protein [Hibiscus syriacus]